MITKEEYNAAKKVIELYEHEQQTAAYHITQTNKLRANEQIQWCEANGGHDFRPSGGKYSSATEMTCCHCPKKLN